MSRAVRAVASYAWSHSIDNGSWDSAWHLVTADITAARDRGPSSFDARHVFSAALGWDAPDRGPFHGLRVDGVVRARTGFPVDVLTGAKALGIEFDNVTRANLVPGVPLWAGGRLNPAAFSVPAGLQGDLGRNALRGFGFSQLDVAAHREFAAGEAARLVVRVEAFNALNRGSLADPVRFLNSPLFGRPTSMLSRMLGTGSPHSGLTPAFQLGGSRMLQVTLKLRF